MRPLRLLLILGAAAGIVAFVIWKGVEQPLAETTLIGFQDYGTPLGQKPGEKADMRFFLPSAWTANQVPTFSSMDPTMGSENGALVYNAQKFWEMNLKRGGYHGGDDLNGIGGMNTDLGDPVFAAANGLVLYAGEPSPGWGKMIILAHLDLSGNPLRTTYAHLDEIQVSINDLIARGQKIGTVGTGNNHYPAHLHLELSYGEKIQIGRGYLSNPLTRESPSKIIGTFHDSSPLGIAPAPLRFADFSETFTWTSLEMSGADKFSELKPE